MAFSSPILPNIKALCLFNFLLSLLRLSIRGSTALLDLIFERAPEAPY